MRISATLLAIALAALPSLAAPKPEPVWTTDLPAAQARAKAEKKAVLLNFTGSDWCGWCIKLRRDVFLKPEFEAYARTNLVLVEVDFPKRKELPPEMQKANRRLAQQFQVQGYPTLILVDASGTKLGTVNYGNGGTRSFIAEAEKVLRPPQPVEPAAARQPTKKTVPPKRYQPASAPKTKPAASVKPVIAREVRQSPRTTTRN
jgi:thioredoxin-related protein